MSLTDKLAKVRALVAEHNQAIEVESDKVNFEAFEKKLKVLGGTSEPVLARTTWEDLQDAGLPKFLAREAADIFRASGRQLLMEVSQPAYISQKKVDRMTYDDLLGQYSPTEDNAVSRKLKELSSGHPFIVLVKGLVNVVESVKLLQELRRGYPPRDLVLVDSKPTKVFKVGERENDLVDENPLYRGRALRPDGTCDQTNRSWEGVPQMSRVILHLALLDTKELNNGAMNVQLAHDLLDFVVQHDASKISQRFPKASLRYNELESSGQLPTLKVSLNKAKSSGGRVEEPFK